MEIAEVSWAAAELGGADLGDARLNRRLVRVAERLGAQPGASIPVACNGWAETQAAYCWLAHEAVTGAHADPLGDCSVERMRGQPVVLCIRDSTELNYSTQPGIAGLGPLNTVQQHGLPVHPTLAVTPDGVPSNGVYARSVVAGPGVGAAAIRLRRTPSSPWHPPQPFKPVASTAT